MGVTAPETCAVGKTYYYGPNFSAGHFNVVSSGVDFSNPAQISFDPAFPPSYVVKTSVTAAGFSCEAGYSAFDTGNSNSGDHSGGIGVATSSATTASVVGSGAWFVPNGYFNSVIQITNGATVVWTSPNYPNNLTRTIRTTLTIATTPVGGFYVLTIRVESSSLLLDHTEIISNDLSDGDPNINLYIAGLSSPVAGNLFTLSYLYLVGAGFSSACLGVPVGIAHGFGGWISIFEDESLTGSAPTLPQAIVVDSDSLKIGKGILIK